MCLFDDLCKKFESVCDDVDEVANHESIRYIERKVQNVGENVMKFYAKIAQVIVSPMIDDLDQFQEEEGIFNQQEQYDAEKISYYTIDTKSTDNDEISFELNDGQQSVDQHYEENYFGTDESSSRASSNLSRANMSIAFDVASSTTSSHGTEEEMLRDLLQSEAFPMNFNEITSSSSAIALQNSANKWYCDYFNFLIDSSLGSSFASSMESSGSSSAHQSRINCEATNWDKEANKLAHDQVKFEESCVIVDYSTPHDDVSSEAQKQHPSFKEKMLNALSSKKRLEGEYKELAILHRENTTKCFEGTSLCDPTKMLLRDSQTIHSSGSEWELI